MRLHVYESGFQDSASAKLRALASRHGWNITPISHGRAFASRVETANDFREWLLLHEGKAKLRRWRKSSVQNAGAFIGLGSAAALVANGLPSGIPKIAIIEQFDSERLAAHCNHDADTRRFDVHTTYHRRIEIELLRTFDRVIANPALVPILGEQGLSNVSSDIKELGYLLTARKAA